MWFRFFLVPKLQLGNAPRVLIANPTHSNGPVSWQDHEARMSPTLDANRQSASFTNRPMFSFPGELLLRLAERQFLALLKNLNCIA